jgi:PEGA domain
MLPLEELKHLEKQVKSASDLNALRPIYYRLGEIARQNDADFEVQLVVEDLKQHVVERGIELRHWHADGGKPGTADVKAGASPAPPPNGSPPHHGSPLLRPDIRRAIGVGAGLGVVAWIILFVILVQLARERNIPHELKPVAPAAPGTVPVDITTTPPGAAVQINNEPKCTSNCRINLPPGNYQVTATLAGFDPAATGVTVVPGASINVSLVLVSQAQTVRVFTDLESGRVLLDGHPAPDLQDGQLVLDRVQNGKHRIEVIGKTSEASFSFELVSGKKPLIDPSIAVTNLFAVLVASCGNGAQVVSSGGPVKVALNGQPQGETGPDGLELKNVSAGDQELSIDDGSTPRKMVVSFGPVPALTAFLKSDVNTGILVVATNEDDATVYVDGRPHRVRRGQLRIPAVGAVTVRVEKPGFQKAPEQRVEVPKGEETRVEFDLKPMPQVASLELQAATPGTLVSVDNRPAGRVAPDGMLSVANVAPGDHTIELRLEGFVPKRLRRHFTPGQTLALTPSDMAMVQAQGAIRLVISPPNAEVIYRRSDGTQTHIATQNPLRLDAGNYIFTVRSPNYLDRTAHVQLAAGESRDLEITLSPQAPAAPKAVGVTDWKGGGWRVEDGQYVRQGGDRVLVRSGSLLGTITFTARLLKGGGIFRSGRLRWFLENGSHYSQFELDRKHFYISGDNDHRKLSHEEVDDREYTVQLDIFPNGIVQKLRVGNRWIVLGQRAPGNFSSGRFGFVIPGSDEVGVSSFHFTPRE